MTAASGRKSFARRRESSRAHPPGGRPARHPAGRAAGARTQRLATTEVRLQALDDRCAAPPPATSWRCPAMTSPRCRGRCRGLAPAAAPVPAAGDRRCLSGCPPLLVDWQRSHGPPCAAVAEHPRSRGPRLAVGNHAAADPGSARCSLIRRFLAQFPDARKRSPRRRRRCAGARGAGWAAQPRAQPPPLRAGRGRAPMAATSAQQPPNWPSCRHRHSTAARSRGLLLRRAGGDPRRQCRRVLSARAGLRGIWRRPRSQARCRIGHRPAAAGCGRHESYTQGLMDLDATVCLPRRNRPDQCPVARIACRLRAGRELNFPVRPASSKRGGASGACGCARRRSCGSCSGPTAASGPDCGRYRCSTTQPRA